MTMDGCERLEKDLACLTRWAGGGTALWRQALRSAGVHRAGASRGESFWRRLVTLRLSNTALAGTALACVFLAAGIMSLPQLEVASVRHELTPKTSSHSGNRADQGGAGHAMQIAEPSRHPPAAAGRESIKNNLAGRDSLGTALDMWAVVRQSNVTPMNFLCASTTASPEPATDTSHHYEHAIRYVIRNATIQLKTDNVRAAFARVQHLVQPAGGEYVEQSSISGEEENTTATLTLRIAADRLSDALNQLRDLGTVISEQQGGQDVTAQAVDLEARLRNERRVETELLELLESRKDAPLKELLELRDSLGRVRSEIERLTGQREHLGRLVSLATVLVIITAKDAADPAPPADGVFAYFGKEMGEAWRAGVYFLADTLTLMVRILVGGAVFWLLLAAVVVIVKRRRGMAQP